MRLYDTITQSDLNGVIDLLLNNYHRELSLNIDDTSNSYCGLSFDLSDGVDAGSEIIFNNGDELTVTISDKRLALMGYTLRLNYYQLDKGDYSQSKPYGELQTLEVKLEDNVTIIPFTDNQVYLQKDFELVLLKDIGYRLLLSTPSSIVLSGDDVVLTADYTYGSVPVEDAEVSFYNGNTLIGTAVTDSDGLAVLTVSDLSTGSYNFNAIVNSNYSNTISVTVRSDTVMTLNVTGSSFSTYSSSPFTYNGHVFVDWGDDSGLVEYTGGKLSHSFIDGLNSHTVRVYGDLISLGGSCFRDCAGLTSINIPNRVSNIGGQCFRSCTSLTSINIPSNVTSLGNYCFRSCTSLTSITLPNNISSLGNYCFHNCTGLTSINIPSSVTSLEMGCFYHCTSLTSINIPSNVTSLGNYCFDNCSSLTSIGLNWTGNNILTYNSNWITYTSSNLKFNIPTGTTSAYTAKSYPADKLEERT